MTRPVDVVRRFCPHAKPSYLAAFENGDRLFKQHDITTPLRLAHFLAQAFHETNGLTIEWESGNYTAQRIVEVFGPGHSSAAIGPGEAQNLAHNGPALFERTYGLGNPKLSRDLGNTQPGDGFKYRGGGIMQTTGRGNYRRMGQKCGVDFETHPEWVLSAEHALKPALTEWSEDKLNPVADRNDILTITKKINGGTNGLDSREQWFVRIKPFITTVTLTDAGAAPAAPAPVPVPAPAPAPAPMPAPAPVPVPPPSNTARNTTTGGTFAALVLAAFSSHKVEVVVALLVAAILIPIIIHKVWPKQG